MTQHRGSRWLQFHLFTLTLATIFLGGLIGRNLLPTQIHGNRDNWPLFADEDDYYYDAEEYGWPLTLCVKYTAKYPIGTSEKIVWNYGYALLNVSMILLGMVLLIFSCEYAIRRKKELRNSCLLLSVVTVVSHPTVEHKNELKSAEKSPSTQDE